LEEKPVMDPQPRGGSGRAFEALQGTIRFRLLYLCREIAQVANQVGWKRGVNFIPGCASFSFPF
jgi:hypothetical protein